MVKWIIFKADKGQHEPNWKERRFAHTGSLTKILAEHLDGSDAPLPEVGYRPPIFVRVEGFESQIAPQSKTHWRQGDWEVVRVEVYEHDVGTPHSEYDTIVTCFCCYNPIETPLVELPPSQVSIDSFGGDREAYDRWLAEKSQTARS
jgi:hypothetical protein